MNIVEDLTRTVRDTISREEGVQLVLNGYVVVETLDVDATMPTLRHYRIGDPTPWAAAGMLHAAVRATNGELDAGFEPDDD